MSTANHFEQLIEEKNRHLRDAEKVIAHLSTKNAKLEASLRRILNYVEDKTLVPGPNCLTPLLVMDLAEAERAIKETE